MAKYSKEFKDNIIKQLLPPTSKLVRVLSKETGVSEQTLYKWKREAKASGQAAPSGEIGTEQWSSEDKFLIVMETAKFNEAELAKYCRERGLYVEQVRAWKDACMSANGSVAEESKTLKKELKEKDKELKKVSIDLKRKEAALAETAALLFLRKKAQAIWGDPEDE